ncbi:MAG TPA: DUF4911 domain-containing protein [candidate division Zixibacteria bacterium]|nr:DUF4911 domain-containing protein [candidate division Zixibacteria bacterium]
MKLETIYLETLPEHIAYVKFIFESYEHVGIVRTVDRRRAVIVLLVVPDFVETARRIVASLKSEIPLVEPPEPVDSSDDWLMKELDDMENGF